MTIWESRIVNAFIRQYPASSLAAIPGGGGEPEEPKEPDGESPPSEMSRAPRPLRIRPERIFPGLEQAAADDRESFLEAAESLERRGLLSLVWARHRKGETLTALVCSTPELLYEFTGRTSPRITAEAVRAAARHFAAGGAADTRETAGNGETADARWDAGGGAFFSFIAQSFLPLDAAEGIDPAALTELARLTAALRETDRSAFPQGITTRALSTALYRDSKRLEYLLDLFSPLLNRARRQGVRIPDFSFLDRSFPETFIAGEIALEFAGAAGRPEQRSPGPQALVNASGSILGLPLETIMKLRQIQPLAEGPPAVLTIENKETFFALSPSLPDYNCFLYTAGHPNRAVRALVSLLAESGFSFHHAGDLDPDGILILQELAEIAGTDISPLRMDAATFDQYLGCGKKLGPAILKRTSLIGEKTRSIPGIAKLIGRIEETGMGVEQEIIDYRGVRHQ
ncbi:MAG: DUF2220 family protein [Treponema sp.]|jgi:hypothetical protein|nr:DUF2220 family protein [Treponema sp.]